jgi:hypothetical protein
MKKRRRIALISNLITFYRRESPLLPGRTSVTIVIGFISTFASRKFNFQCPFSNDKQTLRTENVQNQFLKYVGRKHRYNNLKQ